MKKILSLVVILAMTVTSVWAQNSGDIDGVDANGKTVTNGLHWEFDNMTLKFTNTTSKALSLPDYESSQDVPWLIIGIMPKTLTIGDNITKVGDKCFHALTSLKTVNLSADVTTIGNEAFNFCMSLSSIDLSHVTSVGREAFQLCNNLTSVNLSSATTIDMVAFDYCSNLETVTLGTANTTIGGYAFRDCSELKSIDLSHVTSLDAEAFENCSSLESVSIPLIEKIYYNTFTGCSSLTSVTLGSGKVTFIGEEAFKGCSKLNITSNFDLSKVETIDKSAFSGCSSITAVNIPLVTEIKDETFNNCGKLTSISMPKVTSIGEYAFNNCSELKTISFVNCPTIGNYAFEGIIGGEVTMALTDASSVGTASPDAFPTINTATYTRQLADGQTMGTLVLPFAIKNNSTDYDLGYVSDANVYGITVSNYDDGAEIAANTPILFKAKVPGANLTFTASETICAPSATFVNSSKAGNWSMTGTYTAISSGNVSSSANGEIYYIGTNNTFYYANQDFPVSGFRGWLVTSDQRPAESTAKSSLIITWNNFDANGISNVAAQQSKQNGKFIENGNIVIMKNGKKYNTAGQSME